MRVSFAMKNDKTKMARPGTFWWLRKWRFQAVHVIATITVIAEEKLFLFVVQRKKKQTYVRFKLRKYFPDSFRGH